MMPIDPIVEEVRQNGQAFAARYNHDLKAMCQALKAKEASSNRVVVNLMARRAPARPKAPTG